MRNIVRVTRVELLPVENGGNVSDNWRVVHDTGRSLLCWTTESVAVI